MALLFACRLEMEVRGGVADHDAGLADRRHDYRHFHADRGAVAASIWALFLGLFWYRTLNFKMLIKVSMETIETTATVLFIVAAASIFGWLLTATRVTDLVTAWVLGFTSSPWVFLLLVNLLLLFVGCFLEPTAAILIAIPVLMPAGDSTRDRPRAFRAYRGAQPDDRLAAPADGHGAVRAGQSRADVARAHDDGDPALARCRCSGA
jgi:hypothetical protein